MPFRFGSCPLWLCGEPDEAHSPKDLSTDSLRVLHRLKGRHIPRQVLFVNASKHSKKRPELCACAFTTVAVDLSNTVAIVVARPFSTTIGVVAVAHRPVSDPDAGFDPSIPTPLVGVECTRPEPRAGRENFQAALRSRAIADKAAQLPALSALDREHRRSVIFIGSMPRLLVSSSAWRIIRIKVSCAFFPPRSGIARRSPELHRSWVRRVESDRGFAGPAGGSDASESGQCQALGIGELYSGLERYHAGSGRSSKVSGASSRRRCRSGWCSSGRSPCTDKPSRRHLRHCADSRSVVWSHNVGIAVPLDADAFQATAYIRLRREVRQWGSRSCDDSTCPTVKEAMSLRFSQRSA